MVEIDMMVQRNVRGWNDKKCERETLRESERERERWFKFNGEFLLFLFGGGDSTVRSSQLIMLLSLYLKKKRRKKKFDALAANALCTLCHLLKESTSIFNVFAKVDSR